jgi:DNA-binding transcriptional regulator YhcF (GntR family)
MENEDFDLYADLDEALIEPLQEEVQKKQAEELEKQKKDENFREETEKIISELKASNFQLKKNMSLLLATAKSEIER